MPRYKPHRSTHYQVGYGRPPKGTRFQKGQSGNPKGRPKTTSKSIKTLAAEALRRVVEIEENGRKRKISVSQAIMLRLVNAALKGDLKTANFLVSLEEEYAQPTVTTDADIYKERSPEELLKLYQSVVTRPRTVE